MAFRENLSKKITIGKLANKVLNSLKTKKDAIRKVDRTAMKSLLSMAPYVSRRERDLDLYLHGFDSNDTGDILVLDNDLPLYRTSVADVVLRKSPTVKEMISIRNAIKILNDKDVVISKTDSSVLTIKQQCLELLDLTFKRSDIDELVIEGKHALGLGDSEGVCDILSLFSELLGFVPAPRVLRVGDHVISGIHTKVDDKKTLFGPCFIYSTITHELKFSAEQSDTLDKKNSESFRKMAVSNIYSGTKGESVFDLLLERVMDL